MTLTEKAEVNSEPAGAAGQVHFASAVPASTPVRLWMWRRRWPMRILFILFVLLAVSVIWGTNAFLSARFTEATHNRADLRQALFSGQIMSEVQRTSVVPLLLARDPELIGALDQVRYTTTSQRLISAQQEIGASSILLIDTGGRVVAATDRTRLGQNLANNEGFVQAQRVNDSVFSVTEPPDGGFD
ncbi:MAG: hypothetical protein ORN49_08935, partial [Rhodobacteraceae bacterium]|nr:hypothetical protein [Paracoccaceae bacterium]